MDKSLLVAKRLFEWAAINRVKAKELAQSFGVSPQAITNWKLRGIPPAQWQVAARVMKVPDEVLTTPGDNFDVRSGKARMLPLIDSVHAGNWTGFSDSISYEEYIPVLQDCSKDAFCLLVNGESMRPSLLDGDIVAVDPAVSPKPGDVVVAIHAGAEEATLKRYKAIGLNEFGNEVFELVPDNPLYASYRSDKSNIQIIGVVISFQRKFR